MNIIEHYSDKINGVLSSFDRIIINGYILSLQNPRQFLFYLISNSVKLLDFHSFAKSQTDSLCLHIDSYAKDCGVNWCSIILAQISCRMLSRFFA